MSTSASPSSPSTAVRRVIVGTAGHIDHGKTTLVERLTGIRTDRLPEEKERGMTIDVGYAEFLLPDGTEVGLIDVPGHERLVRTMVAGATSMDLALLVIAADDGPMPQTREHVDILDLLGIRRAVVALTKTDLVPKDHTDMVEEEIGELLKGTTLEGAPVIRVSSVTGEGIDDLKRTIVAAIPPLDDRGVDPFVFRMPILRAFASPGRGTVVTGIPVSGQLSEDEAVEIFPHRWRTRVRGIQVHHRDATTARAGHRAALAIADIDAAQVKRGMVLAAADSFGPTPRFSARFRCLNHLEEPLAHGMTVRVHVGADQLLARLHLLEGDALNPGDVTAIELQGERPFFVAPGDRFVLRAENASATFGGGAVVERLDVRLPRRREGIVASILARAGRLDDPKALVLATLATAGERGAAIEDLAYKNALRADALPAVVEALVAEKAAVKGGRGVRVFHADAYAALRKRVLDAMAVLHKKDAAIPFLPVAAVRVALSRVETGALDAMLEDLVKSGDLRRSPEGGVSAKSHSATMSGEETARCERVLEALKVGAGQPPDENDLSAALNLSPQQVKRALILLETRREVLHAGPFWFHAGWLEGGKTRLAAHVKQHGSFTAGDARTILGTSRKYVIPLLEALDDKGVTKRSGDSRTFR